MSNTPPTSKVQTAIQPWLSVDHGSKAITFYKLAFGAVETYHLDGPDGSVVSRLNVNGAEFWLNDDPSNRQVNQKISL
jgi:PhnB protein